MKKNGQTLVIVLGILVIFMIFIPALVYMVQQESKWTVKQKRTTAAFHAAEAGIDRGMWKIKENSDNFNFFSGGGTLPGYIGTTPYDVYASTSQNLLSQYKVSIGPGAYPTEVLIRSIGRDVSTNEVRAIEVVLTRDVIDAGLSVNGNLEWKPNLTVHWGPVVSYSEFDATSAPFYPKKYSKFDMPGRDPDGIGPINTDNVEWWSYQNLGNKPDIYWAGYKDLALGTYMSDSIPNLTYVAGTKVVNRAVFSGGNVTFKNGFSFTATTGVIFVEGATYQTTFNANSFLDVKAVVAEGSIDFNAKDNTNFTAKIPPEAHEEYKKLPDTAASGEYPGDTGLQSNAATLNIGTLPNPNKGVGMHGLLACGKDLTNAAGNAALVGSYYIGGYISNSNAFTIYYDSAVAANILYSYIPVRQKSWKEVKASW